MLFWENCFISLVTNGKILFFLFRPKFLFDGYKDILCFRFRMAKCCFNSFFETWEYVHKVFRFLYSNGCIYIDGLYPANVHKYPTILYHAIRDGDAFFWHGVAEFEKGKSKMVKKGHSCYFLFHNNALVIKSSIRQVII